MKRHIYQASSSVVVAMLLAVAVVSAEPSYVAVGNIPFDFHVGQATLPSGEYILMLDFPLRGTICIQSKDGSKRAMVIGTPFIPKNKDGENKDGAEKLVFRQYGSDYFLSRVSQPGQPGLELMKTKLESEIAQRASPAHTAEVALGKR